jgi:hypothetical protein
VPQYPACTYTPPLLKQGPTNPSAAAARPQPVAKPVARGQKPEDSRPAPLAMPTPEELGIVMPKSTVTPVDWASVRSRLDRLGATAFTLERAGTGYHFSCRLPTGRSAEGRGVTEADAIRQALEQAERK